MFLVRRRICNPGWRGSDCSERWGARAQRARESPRCKASILHWGVLERSYSTELFDSYSHQGCRRHGNTESNSTCFNPESRSATHDYEPRETPSTRQHNHGNTPWFITGYQPPTSRNQSQFSQHVCPCGGPVSTTISHNDYTFRASFALPPSSVQNQNRSKTANA